MPRVRRRAAWRRHGCAPRGRSRLRLQPASSGATPAERCESLLKHGHNTESSACYQSLVRESSPYLRAEGYWGLAQYSEANEEFRTAVAQAPGNALYKVRWGRMLHERFNDQDAQDLFKEALAKDPNNAASLSRPRTGERRRLLRGRRRMGPQSPAAQSPTHRGPRAAGDPGAGGFRPEPGRRGSRRSPEDFTGRAGRPGGTRQHRAAGRPLSGCVAQQNHRNQPNLWRKATRSSRIT